MIFKIFYNPKTLKIMGSSTGEDSMEFPYVETNEYLHSFDKLEIIEENGEHKLKVEAGTLEDQ